MDENIKRIKIPDELFIWLGKNKITLKDLANPAEHFTMLFNEQGHLDAHKTKEGSEKTYESLLKFDFNQLFGMIPDPEEFEKKLISEFLPQIRKVNFDEPEYANLVVAPISMGDALFSIAEKQKRTTIISKESLQKIDPKEHLFLWKDAKHKIKGNAMVLDGENLFGLLFEKNDEHMLFPINALENTALGKLIADMINSHKDDTEREKESL